MSSNNSKAELDENTSIRLEKAEFLLPLLLGTGDDNYPDEVLLQTAKRLGIVKSDGDCFSVVVSKFKICKARM